MISEKSKFLNESFDYTDDYTRKIILTESMADELIKKLTFKLYKHITQNVDQIDFSTIALSKGIIDKVENYDKLVECIELIEKIYQSHNQSTVIVDDVKNAIINLQDRETIFKRGFDRNNEFICLIYSTIALAIVSSVSLLISTTIQYFKDNKNNTVEYAIDKTALAKTKDHVLFNNLRKFNSACSNGSMDKILANALKMNDDNLLGELIIVSAITFIAMNKVVIPIMRDLIYFFYNMRTNLSEYFKTQADFLTANAQMLIDSGDESKISVGKDQLNLATKLNKISDKFAVQFKVNDVKTKNQIKVDDSNISKIKINKSSNELEDIPSLF